MLGKLFPIGFAASILFLVTPVFSQFCSEPGSIRRIKNTSVGNYEYVVIDLFTPSNTRYAVTTASPPFEEDPSRNPVTVQGNRFKNILFDAVTWHCQIRDESKVPRAAIRDIKKLSQFEGTVEWVVGYRKTSRYITTYHYDVGSIRKVVMKFRK